MEDESGRVWWEAKSFYQPVQDHPYAVVVLNDALDSVNLGCFTSLWQRSSLRVCVDGATNFYHKLALCSKSSNGGLPFVNGEKSLESDLAQLSLGPEGLLLPSIISGDFDSIYPELLTHYGGLGVDIIPTPDQNETDFTKAVTELGKYITQRNIVIKHVVVIASINNDRFDHVMANISTLYKVRNQIEAPLVVVSGGSLFWLLTAGDHTIKVPEDLVLNSLRSWCGLVPLGHPATVTTTGLKWNLDNQVLGFGHLVSTSNTYDPTHEGLVTITTCQPLLWTMGWDIDKIYPPVENATTPQVYKTCSSVDPTSNGLPAIKSKADLIENIAYCP